MNDLLPDPTALLELMGRCGKSVADLAADYGVSESVIRRKIRQAPGYNQPRG